MKGVKRKKGISLIVLVITIIVMIILAAAIILSLNNSGVIDKANKAKKDSDTANLKEYVNILEAEYELMTEAERAGKTSMQYVNDKLAEKYPKSALSADGEVYSDLNDEVRKAVVGGIKIGDEVTGYTLDTSKSSTTTSGKENTAPIGGKNVTQVNTPQIVNQTAYSVWKYIGISDKGEILIAPDMPTTGTVNTMKLSGKGGYLNGPTELNAVCNALYSTDKGTAKSINMDDINRILNYTGPKGRYTDKNGNAVITPEAKKISEIGTLIKDKTPDNRPIENYYANYYKISKDSDDILMSLNTGKTQDVEKKNLLLNFVYTNQEYWIASQAVSVYMADSFADFSIRYVNSTLVHADFMCNSGDYSGGTGKVVRPTIYLNSDVKLTKQTDGSWEI